MDREKVIKLLSDCRIKSCAMGLNGAFFSVEVIDTIISLLKEQQQRIEQLEIERDILVEDINTNNCNTCKRECEHRPIQGDVVRVNCFMWEGR